MPLPATPQTYHDRNHAHLGVPFESCARCEKARQTCWQKQGRYLSMDEAQFTAKWRNEQRNYIRPLVPYRCRWCLYWHHTTASTAAQLHRVEKQRRKWLVEKMGHQPDPEADDDGDEEWDE